MEIVAKCAGTALLSTVVCILIKRINPELSFAAAAAAVAVAIPCLSSPVSAHEFKTGDIEIIHPWSRATPDGARVAAGYLTIRNNGSAPDRLVAITGQITDRAEVHEMKVDENGDLPDERKAVTEYARNLQEKILPDLKIADLAADTRVLKAAQQEALAMAEQDPGLKDPAHAGIKQAVAELFSGSFAMN